MGQFRSFTYASRLAIAMLVAPVPALAGGPTFVEFEQALMPGVNGLAGAMDVAISPHVYVAGEADDAVAAFSQIGCALTQIDVERNGIGGVDGLRRPQNVAISPDGLHVYVSAAKTIGNTTFGTVAVFSRGVGSDLTFVEFQQEGVAGVERLTERVEGLAVSPDGSSVYAGSRGGDAGVTNMLLTLLKDERPTHLGLVFDAPGGSFRDEMYADYKANRSSMPDELVPQIGIIRRVVDALRPRVLEIRGGEADDVIGTLATRVAAAGGEIVIVTGDKDFQQLVGPRITLLDPMFDKHTGVAEVRARYGIEPERWVDIIGLMGDAIAAAGRRAGRVELG